MCEKGYDCRDPIKKKEPKRRKDFGGSEPRRKREGENINGPGHYREQHRAVSP